MSKFILIIFTLCVGAAVGYFLPKDKGGDSAEVMDDNKPLYWVAPMDPNFQRDQPGLSPMGMELVPVYAEDLAGGDSPGTISISPEVENNLAVRTTAVLFSPLQAQIKTVGYVGLNPATVTYVHSRISGWVEAAYVSEQGEYVEQGSLLYEVYSPELVNAQEEWLAASQSGNRFLRNASEAKLKALGVSAEVFALLKKGRKALQKVPVHALSSGYIQEINLKQGMYIKPDIKLLSLAPLDRIWVTAELFERQGQAVQVGDVAELEITSLAGRKWRGEVDYIYPTLNAATRTLNVRLRFANPDLLMKPDMFAHISIQTAPSSPVLNVPESAVIRTGEQNRVVLALGEGRFKSVEVTLGATMAGRVAILNGLYPEDKVVTAAQFMLDSESSISSDFLRMTPPKMGIINEVWVSARLQEVDSEQRLLTFRHAPIREWQQDEMLMQVPADSALDLDVLQGITDLQLRLTGANMGELKVTDYVLPRPKAPSSLSGGRL